MTSLCLVADPIVSDATTDEEWFDDDTKTLPNATYEEYTAKLIALGLRSSRDETSVSAALQVLDDMFRHYVMTEDETVYPDLPIYNHILTVLAYGRSEEATQMAVQLYNKLSDATNMDTPMADMETHGIMMDVWMERDNQLQNSIQVFDSVEDKDVTLWNKLIQAYGRAGAPAKAIEAFERMDVPPNEKTFIQLLRSQRANGKTLQDIWEKLPMQKTVELYNAYLLGQKDAKTTERILYGMMQEGLSPDAETIHQVIRAHATYGIPSLKLEQFFTLTEQAIPDRTYAIALQALSHHAQCPRKAQKAKSILSRFAKPPSVSAVRSAIRSCATVPVDSFPEDKLEAFQIGMEIYQTAEHKERLHGNALQLAANLLPPGSEKLDVLAKALFTAATSDGTANEFCVMQFRRAASPSLQLQMFGGDFDDLLQLPKEWSRHVDHDKSRR